MAGSKENMKIEIAMIEIYNKTVTIYEVMIYVKSLRSGKWIGIPLKEIRGLVKGWIGRELSVIDTGGQGLKYVVSYGVIQSDIGEMKGLYNGNRKVYNEWWEGLYESLERLKDKA